MITACWSVKGGSGTTVVAAALAVLASASATVRLVDLEGDVPAVLGLPEPTGPGLAEWCCTPERPPAALARLGLAVRPGLEVVGRGAGTFPTEPAVALDLLSALGHSDGPAIVDCGLAGDDLAASVVDAADRSLLVLRPCYLAVRRASLLGRMPTGLVVVSEPGRALTARDLEDVLQVPVVAQVTVEPAVARAVDAGLLASRLPRVLERSLRRAA